MTNPTPPQRPDRPIGPYEQSLIESRASRKALEARLASARRRRKVGAVVAVVALAGGAVGGVMWWLGQRSTDGTTPTVAGPTGKPGCTDPVPVTLWAAPSIQPAAVALVKAYQAQPESPCVDYQVIARKPIEAMLGLGKGQPNRPDAWIPDSPLWVDRVNAAAGLHAKAAVTFATSPVVIAMDPAEAAKLDAPPKWLELVAAQTPIRISDPGSTTAGMLTLATALPNLTPEQSRQVLTGLAKRVSPSTDQLFADYNIKPQESPAFAASEADLIEHNRVNPDHKMVSVVPTEGTPSFEYSLINVATDPSKGHGIEEMRSFLRTPQAAKILASFGLRSTSAPVTMPTPPGSIGEVKVGASPAAERIVAATNAWQAATVQFQLLSVFDVSGSMNEKVGNTTRAAITQEAAGIALNALPKTTNLGMWVFSIDKGGKGVDYKEIVPIGPLADDTHRALAAVGVKGLTKQIGGGTGLYDTIWASYQKVKASYAVGRVNAVVILTDGKNEDPNGMTLPQLMARLKSATDPTKPIAITTVGIGPDADATALKQISRAYHSDYYGATNPAEITTVLARALFDNTCSGGTCA